MKFRSRILHEFPLLTDLPAGYQRLGNVMLLRSVNKLSKVYGDAIIKVIPWCEAVYQYHTTEGESRIPRIRYLSGTTETIVHHRENGVTYILDIAKIMFSAGNTQLRKDLIDEVKDGEFVVDMFAAVGNLSLQVFKYRKIEGVMIEKNKYTFSYLKKTINYNKISNVKLINDDCSNISLVKQADRIFLGYHDISNSHIDTAIKIAKDKAILHFHPIIKVGDQENEVKKYRDIIIQFGINVINIDHRKIKNYSPGLIHIEIAISIDKNTGFISEAIDD